MDKTHIAVVILAVAMVSGVLIAIRLGQGMDIREDYRLGWMGSEGPNYMKYQYKEFTGTENRMIYVNEPCNITIRYSIGVVRGRLILELVSPRGDIMWVRSFSNSTNGEDKVFVETPGWYNLVIIGQHTEGYFDVSWSAG